MSILVESSADSTDLGHCVQLPGLWKEGDLWFFPGICLHVLAVRVLVTPYPLLSFSVRGDPKLFDQELRPPASLLCALKPSGGIPGVGLLF